MDGFEGKKDSAAVTKQVVAGLRGPTVFNGEMSRLTPGLTFKDAVPDAVKQEMNLSTPKQGQMLDSWVTRKPGQK